VRSLLRAAVREATGRDWRVAARPWGRTGDGFFGRMSLPPLSGTKSPSASTAAAASTSWSDRIALNSHLYQTNYVVVFAFAHVLLALRHPWAVFVLGALIVAWVYATSPRPLVLSAGSRRITRRERFAFATLVSFVLLVVTRFFLLFALVGAQAALLVLAHASFRKAGGIRSGDSFGAGLGGLGAGIDW
jgi:PRA1 family protein